MQLRCYRCGWSFAIKQEEIAFALQALEQDGGGHYDVRCPRCRHTNRLSIEQLQRAAPRREPGSAVQTAQEAADQGSATEPGAAESEPDASAAEE